MGNIGSLMGQPVVQTTHGAAKGMATVVGQQSRRLPEPLTHAYQILMTPLFGTKRRVRPPAWDQRQDLSPDQAANAYIGYSPAQNRYIAAAWQREQLARRTLDHHRQEYEQALESGDQALAAGLAEGCFIADENWRKADKALRIVIASAGPPTLRTPQQELYRAPDTASAKTVKFVCIGIALLYLAFQLLPFIFLFGVITRF